MDQLDLVKGILQCARKEYLESFVSPLILKYHHVSDLKNDPQMLAITPRRFEDQIKYLKENYLILRLEDLIEAMHNDIVLPNSVVITFDSGYSDNLLYIKPIVEKYQVPATIFISTGMLESRREFWWDELEKIFCDSKIIGKELNVNKFGFTINKVISSKQDSIEIYKTAYNVCENFTISQRDEVLHDLLEWSGVEQKARDTHRVLTNKELVDLSKSNYITIGAHTVNHGNLSVESSEIKLSEIIESKISLQNLLGYKVNTFSYSFGGTSDVDPDSIELVKKAGFTCGISNIQGNVDKNGDIFLLNRRIVRNWDLNQFVFHMDSFTKKRQLDIFDFASDIFCNKIEVKQIKAASGSGLNYLRNEDMHNKDKAHILSINTIDNKGGAANVAYNLCEDLNRNEQYQATMLVDRIYSESNFTHNLMRDNSKEHRILYDIQHQEGWLDLFHLSSFDIFNYETFRKCDILHLHNIHGNYFTPLVMPILTNDKPTVWTLHDMQAITGHCAHSFECERWIEGCHSCPYLNVYPEIAKDQVNALWKLKKNVYEESKLTVVCPSKWLKDKVERSILKNHSIHLIYNGIDETIFKRTDKVLARKTLNLPQDKKILLFSADMGIDNKWKGGSYLLELYQEMKCNDDILFLNVGTNGNKDSTEKWINFEYIYDKHMMALLYSAADVFVYPSLADNCPLVVLEAMACGTPVVSFKTGGIPELVHHMETGYLAEYKDTKNLLNGVKLFVKDEILKNRCAMRAVSLAKEKFTLTKMVNEYINLYNVILNKP